MLTLTADVIADDPYGFSAVVSNPPYQVETAVKETVGQKTVINIFQYFQTVANEISEATCMVYPGERWVHQSGQGMKEFGQEQLNSESLQQVMFFPASNSLFGGEVGIQGGVSIVLTDSTRSNHGQWLLISLVGGSFQKSVVKQPVDSVISLNPVENRLIEKVRNGSSTGRVLNERISGLWTFNLESSFVEENPSLVVKCDESFGNCPKGDGWLRALLNDKSGKAGRAMWYWLKEANIPDYRRHIRTTADPVTFKYRDLVRKWKVIASSVNLSGANGRSPNAEILDSSTIFGRSRISLGMFDSREEAVNFFNWVRTDFIRALAATSGDLLGSFASNVPDPVDFRTGGDSGLDFTESEQSLNDQLCDQFNLTADERAYIASSAALLAPFSKFSYSNDET